MTDIKEKFAPDSFFSETADDLIISYDLKGQGYYKITTQDAQLYISNGLNAADGSLKLSPIFPLDAGTQFLAKAFYNAQNVFYATIVSGPHKLNQGFIRIQDAGNLKPKFVNPEFLPLSTTSGKIDLEIKAEGDFPVGLYKDAKGKHPYKDFASNDVLGALANGTPLERITKKKSKYIKVRVLAGVAKSKTGYVEREFTVKPKDTKTLSDNIKDVTLPADGAMISLTTEYAIPKIKEISGVQDANVKDPTFILSVFNRLRRLPAAQLAQTNITFYNQTDKTVDIVQPFYFGPAKTSNQYYSGIYNQLTVIDESIRPYYVEPYARVKALQDINAQTNQGDKFEFSDLSDIDDTEFIYRTCAKEGIILEQLGRNFLFNEKTRAILAESAGEFLKLNPAIFEDVIANDAASSKPQIVVTYNPKIVSTARWGFFTYKIPLTLLVDTIVPRVLNLDAVNFLTNLHEGTSYGAEVIHGFLSELPPLLDEVAEVSLRTSDLESRLPRLSKAAQKFFTSLSEAGKSLYIGNDEKTAELQKSVITQLDTIKGFSTFVKTSVITGQATAQKLKSVESLGVRIQIKNQFADLAAIILENTQLANEGMAFATPIIPTTNQLGQLEEVVLYSGKTCLIEQDYIKQLDAVFSSFDITEMKGLASYVGEALKGKKADSPLSDMEYIFVNSPKDKALKRCVALVLASIVRTGVQQRKFDLGTDIPFNLQIDEMVDKKLVSITDFAKLQGPFKLGKDQEGKEITYSPDYPSLLRQLRWLTFDSEGKSAKLDYSFLQIKQFSNKTHQAISGYGSPEYSMILSLVETDFEKLVSADNYKDFFDKLYKYSVFYKPSPPATPPTKPLRGPVLNSFGDVFQTLSPLEKEQLLTELYKRKYTITEQAFGGSGCLEFALKSVQTFDDLYNNIMNKANWAFFIAQAIDRFKCELSKLGGGDLACLADFDVMGTYRTSLEAREVIENFPELFEDRLKQQPLSPILGMIYNRRVPSMPSIDWYKCLRAFLLGLILKIMTELIVGFVQMILALLDVECDADFSSCQQSELDPNTSDIGVGLNNKKGEVASSGLTPQNSEVVASQLRAIDIEITSAKLQEFVRFLASQMPIANFKALLNEDTPIHIFNHGKFLANNFFAPVTFADSKFRTMLNILNASYEYEAFIAATLFEQIAPGEQCPPKLVNGQETLDAIKDALKQKLIRERGNADDADDIFKQAEAELEERTSAFCEILNIGTGVLNEVSTAPALLAGFSNFALAQSISGIISQLRIKPYYDYKVLKFLFTGDMAGDNPDKEDILRADLSLAYNVLYGNYGLSRVLKTNGQPETRSYVKQYNLFPYAFSDTLSYRQKGNTTLLRNDGFEKEFLQDVLKVVIGMNPFLFPLYPSVEAALFDVEQPVAAGGLGTLNEMDKILLGVSRELNNPNYFYAWLENILALLPILDPRRFPKKYKEFVSENYPNAIEVDGKSVPELIHAPFSLTHTLDEEGLHYKYGNSSLTLLKLDIGLEEFNVDISEGRTRFTRDLPKLSEPFFVDELQDYKEMVKKYPQMYEELKVKSPQEKIYYALGQKSLDNIPTLNSTQAKELYELIQVTFSAVYDHLDDELDASIGTPDQQVADFFFRPFIKANNAGAIKIQMDILSDPKASADNKETAKDDLIELLKGVGNPKAPVTLFFQRSDNLLNDVFFEESAEKEIQKIITKVEATLKDFYRNLTDGKKYDPKALGDAIARGSVDSKAFYEMQKIASSKLFGEPLSIKMTKFAQQKVLEAVKEVTT